MRQSGIIAAPARVAVDETFLGGKLAASHATAREIGGMWEGKGGELEYEVESNMVWLDLAAAGCGVEEFVRMGVEEGVKVRGGRLVVHYQIGREGMRRLGRVMDRVLGGERKGGKEEKEEDGGVGKKVREVMEPEME